MKNDKIIQKNKKTVLITVICIVLMLTISLLGGTLNKKTYSLTCPIAYTFKQELNLCCIETFSEDYNSNENAIKARDRYLNLPSASAEAVDIKEKTNADDTKYYELAMQNYCYAPSLGSEKVECDIGEYLPEGASSCIECEAGSYCSSVKKEWTMSSTQDQGKFSCAIGYYQDKEGKTSCTKCPDGKTTDSTGSKSASDCREYKCTTTNECETHKVNCEESGGTFKLTADNTGSCTCGTGYMVSAADAYSCIKSSKCDGINDPSDRDENGHGWENKEDAKRIGAEECSKEGKGYLYHDWGGDGCYNYYCVTESSGGSSKGDSSDNGNTNQGSNSGNVTENAQTGSALIYTVWIIGIAMIGYAIWYFKENSKINS